MRHFAYVLARLAIQGAVVMLLAAGPALAASDGINVVHVSLDPFEDGWAINAEFDVHLKPRMEEALVHGLPLYFVVDFELTRSRWYWFDEKAASASITYRLSFHELTRQYRLSTG